MMETIRFTVHTGNRTILLMNAKPCYKMRTMILIAKAEVAEHNGRSRATH